MEPGICYIKKEFLLPDVKAGPVTGEQSSAEPLKRKLVEENGGDEEHKVETEVNGSPNKFQKTIKKDRKRGQNKNRPIYKDNRDLHLCRSLINGPGVEECKFPNCRYVHDLEQYLTAKGDDLGEECAIFVTKGYCPRGVTCRFAKSHLDAEGRNVKSAHYDETQPATTVNGITSESQIILRKREYDFTRSKDLVKRFEKLREHHKQEQLKAEQVKKSELKAVETIGKDEVHKEQQQHDEPQKDIDGELEKSMCAEMESVEIPKDQCQTTASGKPIGSAVDDVEMPGRDVYQKPPVDFAGKVVLSPLTTVGNLPFRRICKEFGADITCGEMACAVPLVKGLTQEWALTKRHSSEDVFGVQLCGSNPTIITQAAQLLQETAKVDFLDLNIGCPIDLIYQNGGGAALMRRTNILELAVRSCAALSPKIPFTVKMRTGVYADKSVAHELLPMVEEWGAAAVTLHGRSREQRYTKHANWEYIEKCAAAAKHMPVIGNGDILNFEDYNDRKKKAPHVSSVMIGRGALIKPWIFKEVKEQQHWNPTSSERFDIVRKYVNYGLEHWGSDTKGVENTRRFLLEWQSFMYRYIPYDLLEYPPQTINQRPQKYRGRDEMETLLSSPNSADWVKLSEMLLGRVPEGFSFVPKHKANAY